MAGKPRSSGKRKQWKRKNRRVRKYKSVNVNKALQPIPQRYICKLKFSYDATTTASGNLRFRMNSLYDPAFIGGVSPRQPYSFDQLAVLYNRYRVIACGYRCTAANVGASAGPFIMSALPANEQVTPANASTIRENPRAKYVTQQPGGQLMMLKGKTYIPSLVGRNKTQYMADDRYQAETTANPSENAVLNLTVFDVNGAPITTGVVINTLLEFTVEFFDVKTLAQS